MEDGWKHAIMTRLAIGIVTVLSPISVIVFVLSGVLPFLVPSVDWIFLVSHATFACSGVGIWASISGLIMWALEQKPVQRFGDVPGSAAPLVMGVTGLVNFVILCVAGQYVLPIIFGVP